MSEVELCSRPKGGQSCRGFYGGHRNPAAPGSRWCQPCKDWSSAREKQRRDDCRAHDPDAWCSYCRKLEGTAERYRASYRDANFRAVLRRHGLTAEDYDRMLRKQGGVCAICRGEEIAYGNPGPSGRGRRVRRLAIDHCHRTGKVRGLLCNNCNRALGMFEDDVDFLRAAVKYLERGGS